MGEGHVAGDRGRSAKANGAVLRWLTVRICDECSFDWDLTTDGVLRTLASFPDAYRTRLDRFRRAPDAGVIRQRPSPEVWSALEYTVHVRDVIDFYADLSTTPGTFVVYDDGYRTWSYTYAEVAAAGAEPALAASCP